MKLVLQLLIITTLLLIIIGLIRLFEVFRSEKWELDQLTFDYLTLKERQQLKDDTAIKKEYDLKESKILKE